MKIHVRPFGAARGEMCQLYTLTNDAGAQAKLTNYAGALVGVTVPDKKGRPDNVVLGFENVKGYVKGDGYLGALIGPVGNRIAGAAFAFDGQNYAFAPNENGCTLLHSGDFGFHTHVWNAEARADADEACVTLTSDFPQEKTGFPGNLKAEVTYTFNNANELRIDYRVQTDRKSFLSPTNHAYFNLGGTGAKHLPSVERQKIEIFADFYTQMDALSIPTGVCPVDGTAFDLRAPVKIGEGLEAGANDAQIGYGGGYDHNYILSGAPDADTGLRLAARVTDERTGRVMRVYTDMPCVQFYTANQMRIWNPDQRRYFRPREALCLETQCAPDSAHHAGEFGYQVWEVTPEAPFHSQTVYAFSTK